MTILWDRKEEKKVCIIIIFIIYDNTDVNTTNTNIPSTYVTLTTIIINCYLLLFHVCVCTVNVGMYRIYICLHNY